MSHCLSCYSLSLTIQQGFMISIFPFHAILTQVMSSRISKFNYLQNDTVLTLSPGGSDSLIVSKITADCEYY